MLGQLPCNKVRAISLYIIWGEDENNGNLNLSFLYIRDVYSDAHKMCAMLFISYLQKLIWRCNYEIIPKKLGRYISELIPESILCFTNDSFTPNLSKKWFEDISL